MTTLIEAIQSCITDMPDSLNSKYSIYIKGRRIQPDAEAQIAPTDDRRTLRADGWRLLQWVEFVQEAAYDALDAGKQPDATAILADLQSRGYLLDESDDYGVLQSICSDTEIAARYSVSLADVRSACERGDILARLSGETWLMFDYAAAETWG